MMHDDYLFAQHQLGILPVDVQLAAQLPSTSFEPAFISGPQHEHSALVAFVFGVANESASHETPSDLLNAFFQRTPVHQASPSKDTTGPLQVQKPVRAAHLVSGDSGGIPGDTGPYQLGDDGDTGYYEHDGPDDDSGDQGTVAGGEKIQQVEVPGRRPGPSPQAPIPAPSVPPSDNTPANGGGPAPAPCVPQHTSPIPEKAPAGIDVNALRKLAMDLARQFDLAKREGEIEHGSLIYANGAGELRASAVFPGTESKVDTPYEPHPGERVVAWIHSHPAGTSQDQRYMSPGDEDQMRDMIEKKMADPNMLSYIKGNDAGGTGVFEFQSTYHYSSGTGTAIKPKQGTNIARDVSTGGCKP